MGAIDYENVAVFTLGGMSLEGLKNMMGGLWEKLPEDVRNEVEWVGQTGDGDGYNPGAVRAISHLITELADGIKKDKVTIDQAAYLWEQAVDTLREHNLFGPRMHVLYKDYSNQDPMMMLGHILNVSEDFLSAKAGIRK
jgi:hypothetical protein